MGTFVNFRYINNLADPMVTANLLSSPFASQILPSLIRTDLHDWIIIFSSCFEIMRLLMESSLESAINMDAGEDRLTAKEEPALAVSLRHPNNPLENQGRQRS